MADEDEIDVLGDFTFTSCFAQNNQGIPSCSSREDTVHPQWLSDSTEANWYDKRRNRFQEGSPRKLYGNKSSLNYDNSLTTWTHIERDMLDELMAKYGRNVHKISKTLKTKTEAEIQALIEAEYGVNLDTLSFGLDEDYDDVPAVVQEEIVTEEMTLNQAVSIFTTGDPTISSNEIDSKSLLKPNILPKSVFQDIDPADIYHEEELILGSTESVHSERDLVKMCDTIMQYQAINAVKKKGNKSKLWRTMQPSSKNKSKELLKSPPARQRKDSGLPEDSPKKTLQSSCLSLSVFEGEQVIKIEKKKDSDPDSDIEIDVDSDSEGSSNKTSPKKDNANNVKTDTQEAYTARLPGGFAPMPKRLKKINLDGDGGYTVMHTEAGDLVAVGVEPKRVRAPRVPCVPLLACRRYTATDPAPFQVRLHVSSLLLMEGHAHTSQAEVMGLLGGALHDTTLTVAAYRPALSAGNATHCEMDPVSQDEAAEWLRQKGWQLCGWHHSHPQFPSFPSDTDVWTQHSMQNALDWSLPFVGIITSQHWPTMYPAPEYRCIRVDEGRYVAEGELPRHYAMSMKLEADLVEENLPDFLQELRAVLRGNRQDEFSHDMSCHTCPNARITYLEKYILSARHYLEKAEYEPNDPVVQQVIEGIRDVFR